MKVILKETIDSLGIIGSEVTVADGYARNYLLPQGKAVPATDQYRKLLEHERAKFDLQIAKEKELAEQMAQKLEAVECEIAAKVHEGEQLYGSVTVRDIVDALKKQDISVEKRMVLLKGPIKTIGSFKVPIRVYKEVEPEITVNIVPEQ
ncbi:MAG: 50S ribosomal protein L9 [Desulfobacteraceae bacterium]|jgi:large subunit ribosomal protein L9